MSEQNWNQADVTSAKEEFNIKQQLERYFMNWKWFVLSSLLCLLVAFLYLRYTTPMYSISTTVLVKVDKRGLAPELGAFADIPGISMGNMNLENEMEIVRSRNMLAKTIKDLNLNISYFTDGRVITTELYNETPIKVQFFDKKENFDSQNYSFTLKTISQSSLTIANAAGEIKGTYKFGATISLPFAKMVVIKKREISEGSTVMVRLSSMDRVINKFYGKLSMGPTND